MVKVKAAAARRAEIVSLATTSGLASVEELSEQFGVTASTIRRDLARLTAQGKLARTYGGAMSIAHSPEASLRQRLGEAHAAKRAIGRWAAAQVRSGETVLLDAGSTVGALAQGLHERTELAGLRVVAAGLTSVGILAETPGVEIVSLGGRLRPISQAFVGPLATSAVTRMSFDRAFMGADSVHAEWGICEADHDQTRLKELIMGRAEHTYVLAHADKLGATAFHAWAVMPARWTLVTDDDASAEQVAAFREQGVEVVVVPV